MGIYEMISMLLSAAIAVMAALLLLVSRHNNGPKLRQQLDAILARQERLEMMIREEISGNRRENSDIARQNREEQALSLKNMNEALLSQMHQNARSQNEQLESFSRQLGNLTHSNEERIETVRKTIEDRLKALQEDNSGKLEQMRATVDEKLHATLEKRLGESFQLVSDRLEKVHNGLGEMRELAAGVGDLKKVMANVKTRGIWGEIQLGNILDTILAPEQYARNIITRPGSSERVEFAVCLPGQGEAGEEIWLPIDAKFPLADYQNYLEACEAGDQGQMAEAARQMENTIRIQAKTIQEKYLDPPNTTDFAIMFLPTESLYAEVVRRPGLLEELQANYRINITGPSTMAAFLNSLSLGFKTLAIAKRSSEVWRLLGGVKTEFGQFGDMLDKTRKKLQEASNHIDKAAVRSRAIERKLRDVEALPSPAENCREIAAALEEE